MKQKRAALGLHRFLLLLRRNVPALLLCAALGAQLAYTAVRLWLPQQYQAAALLLVEPRTDRSVALTAEEIGMAKQMAGTYAVLLNNDTLLEDICKTWQMEQTPAQLRQRITAHVVDGTQLIRLSVRDEDAALALSVLQSMVASAPAALAAFVGGGALQVVSPPRLQEEPLRPGGVQALLAGAGAGLILCVLWFFIRAFTTRRFLLWQDVERQLGLPVVGCLPLVRGRARIGGVLSWQHSDAPALYRERMESLCVNVRFLLQKRGCKVLLLTSAAPREGKSSVAVNLAAGLANTGHRVLLVEGNLRSPALRTLPDTKPPAVLQDALEGASSRDACVYPAPGLGFWVLPARQQAGACAVLLGSPAMQELMAGYARQYDIILIDGPAAPLADAAVLSRLAGGVLLAVRQRGASCGQVAMARRNLDAVDAQWLGVVCNEFDDTGR